jgi:ATP-dependent helicase/nuclease subunit A
VLILVRQRGALFGAVIRALKNAGVAVAGADRLVLTEHIAIIDLMALADALLLTQDDLALAVALKSPLFGFDDDLLFELAWERRASLRATLAAGAADRAEFAAADALLRRCEARARLDSPFAFFAWLLGPEQGRRKILARLGLEAADALDEFLELALEYERHEAPSLQGFVAWLRGAATVVKRDMETARDEVRVMTVHGAKGLEAPVVILADTTTPPKGSHPPTLLEIEGASGTPTGIVWAGRRDQDVGAVAMARQAALDENEHEYRRLLYVAMTRAAERLIVCGCHGKKKPTPECWYDLIRRGLDGQPGFEEFRDGDTTKWRYRKAAETTSAQCAAVACPQPPLKQEGRTVVDPPAWLTTPVPAESAHSVMVSPSSAYEEALAPQAPRQRNAAQEQAQAQALARGTLIHRLLQSLPDIEPARREAVALSFLARAGAAFSMDERNRFVGQTLAIFADPRFAQLFAPGSRAEVPIVGRLRSTRGSEILVSGQIDRLAITPHAALIADYKTNRDPPTNVDAAPPAYVGQLALYRAVLSKIYPDRPIRVALVWTELPDLMELPADMLDQALVRITSA